VHQVGFIYKTNVCVTTLSALWNTAVNVILQALNLKYSGVRYILLIKLQYAIPHWHTLL